MKLLEWSRWCEVVYEGEGGEAKLAGFPPGAPPRLPTILKPFKPLFPHYLLFCDNLLWVPDGKGGKSTSLALTPHSKTHPHFTEVGISLRRRHMVRPATDGPGLALAVLNEIRTSLEWFSFLSFFFLFPRLAFMTVSWCEFILEIRFMAKNDQWPLIPCSSEPLAWLVCLQLQRGAWFKGKVYSKCPKILSPIPVGLFRWFPDDSNLGWVKGPTHSKNGGIIFKKCFLGALLWIQYFSAPSRVSVGLTHRLRELKKSVCLLCGDWERVLKRGTRTESEREM